MQLAALFYNWQAIIETQVFAYLTGDYGEAAREELHQTGRPVELLQLWEATTL